MNRKSDRVSIKFIRKSLTVKSNDDELIVLTASADTYLQSAGRRIMVGGHIRIG